MNASILNTLILATLALCASGAALAEVVIGSGRMATESRAVSGFNSVSVSVPGKVKLTQGKSESLTITADDNLLPWIETVVEEGMLRIRYRKPSPGEALMLSRETISITLAARDMEAIHLRGSADIASGPLKATRLVFNISGSGNMEITSVETEDVAVSIGGSGDLAIRGGRTNTLGVRISGSGEVKAAKLESRSAKVRIAGSGDATLWARDALEVRVAGSGDVRYYGDPRVERSVAGSGDIRRAGTSPN